MHFLRCRIHQFRHCTPKYRLRHPRFAEVADFSKTRTGWTIGGGSEWMFAQGWSAFLEYDHADFGTNTGTFNSALLGPISIGAKSNVDLFLVGFNWRPHF
jgi:opacity protein-like surface antigen